MPLKSTQEPVREMASFDFAPLALRYAQDERVAKLKTNRKQVIVTRSS